MSWTSPFISKDSVHKFQAALDLESDKSEPEASEGHTDTFQSDTGMNFETPYTDSDTRVSAQLSYPLAVKTGQVAFPISMPFSSMIKHP